jgi:hypothetical protein
MSGASVPGQPGPRPVDGGMPPAPLGSSGTSMPADIGPVGGDAAAPPGIDTAGGVVAASLESDGGRGGSAVLSPGAASAAPGGALHFGTALRTRFAAAGGRRPAAVAGLPFATLGRRMAPAPAGISRHAAPGLAWRALGAAPVREEPAPSPAPRPWQGALGTAPAAAGDKSRVFDAGDPPLPARLPAELGMAVPDAAAPFQPLPQAPVHAALSSRPSAPVAGGGSAGSDGSAGSAGSSGSAGSGDVGGEMTRAMPVFPGLPQRLVPTWAAGAPSPPPAPDVGPAPAATPYAPLGAGSAAPASSTPSATRPADAEAGGGTAGHVMAAGAGGSIPLPDRAPRLVVATAAEATGDVRPTRTPLDATMADAPALTWAGPSPGGTQAREAEGGAAAAGGFAAEAGAAPLAWALPDLGVGGPRVSDEAPRLAWAEASAGAVGAAGAAGATGAEGAPGPYAPTLLHGITLAAQAVATAAAQRETVREARREALEAARPAPQPAPPPPAPDPTSDDVVRTIMRKMTAMAREERFRAGGLR